MSRRNQRLRPAGFDELGLRRALADRALPFMVAAMAFLAALGLAGWVGAAALAQHWQAGAEATLTVQVPQPDEPAADDQAASRARRVLDILRRTPAVAEARLLSGQELAALLRPWLGTGEAASALPLPGVIAVRLADPGAALEGLAQALARAAPGTLVESHGLWMGRLSRLARSLQACAGASLAVLAAVAAAVIAVATRAGLAARREAIEIVHGLGASDGYIARRFAARATALAASGALLGAVAATPALIALHQLAAPFMRAETPGAADAAASLTPALWMLLPGLPIAAAGIGFATAQATVRSWLRRLP